MRMHSNLARAISFICAALLVSSAFGQTGNSEIFLFDISHGESGYRVTGGNNISKKPGYDNQPSFSTDGASLLFTSDRDKPSTDIYEYMIDSGKTTRITSSEENEYTARSTGENTVAFVREGKGQGMTVWTLDRSTGVEKPALANKEPVAYHDWNSKGGAMVWVRYAWTALYLVPSENVNIFVSDRVQPSSPQNIPGTDKFSFLHRQGNDALWIKEFDPSSRAVRPIVRPRQGSIDYCWLPDGTIVTGTGSKLFGFNEKRDDGWFEMADLSKFGLKDITRLASSLDGKKLAVVSNQ